MLKFPKSKQRFGVFVLSVTLLNLVGCASNKVTTSELLSHTTNCDHVEANIAFIDQNTPGRAEQILAGVELITFGIFTSDKERKAQIANGSSAYWAQSVKEDYYRKCLKL